MDTPEVKTESTSSENGDTKQEPSEAASPALSNSMKQKKGKHSLILFLPFYSLSGLCTMYQPLIFLY